MSLGNIMPKAFPFEKMVQTMLSPEMIEGTAKIFNEAMKDRPQVARIFNSCAGGNATLIAEYKDGGQ